MSAFSKMASFDDDIDFRKVWRVGLVISAVLVALSIYGIVGRGLVLGIDFEGGTSWDVPTQSLSVQEARDTLRSAGEAGAKIQAIGRGGSRIVRVQSVTSDQESQIAISKALAEAADISETEISVSTVGPSWGDQVSSKAQRALVYFFIVISLYMAIRLEWKMAIGALVSVVHDLLISVGFYAVLQIEITPATVIAFLTILGYSLYDTIVVFDRMQENTAKLTAGSKTTYTGMVSLSLNQTLMRSINTTITSLLPVLAMLLVGSSLLGAVALREFALALAVGLTSGAFSSVMIAAPVVAWIKEREPKNRALRERVLALQGPLGNAPMSSSAADSGITAPVKQQVVPGSAPTLSGRPIPPRPRKKGKKR